MMKGDSVVFAKQVSSGIEIRSVLSTENVPLVINALILAHSTKEFSYATVRYVFYRIRQYILLNLFRTDMN